MSEGPAGLEWLREDEFARIEGLPMKEGPTNWHVNEHIVVSHGGDGLTGLLSAIADVARGVSAEVNGYILQRADATHEWLVLTVSDGEIGSAFHASGIGSEPNEFDASDLEVTSIAETQGELNA